MERPNRGLLSSSEVYRINSTAAKIGEAFGSARHEAMMEALWLADVCRELLRDNDRLRVVNEKQSEQLARFRDGTN